MSLKPSRKVRALRCAFAIMMLTLSAHKLLKSHDKKHPALRALQQEELELLRVKAGVERTIILTGLSYEYIRLHENLVCNLKMVGGFDKLISVAFDEQTFHWGVAHKLDMIRLSHSSLQNTLSEDVRYGTSAYKLNTKLKSLAVLTILNAGYSVIFTDVDVVWFTNPFEALQPYWITDFIIQHDSKHDSLTKFNSGLYGVHSTSDTTSAFERIVAAALHSNSSEQPHFQHILCQNRTLRGDCRYQSTVIKVLPSETFPNGGWRLNNNSTFFQLGSESFKKLTKKPLHAVHNNWIVGIEQKIRRQQEHHLWWVQISSFCA